MNCNQAQQKMLLIDSGELTGCEAALIEEHAASCPDCRAWRENVRAVCAMSDKALLRGEPSSGALARIRQAAEARAGHRHSQILFFPMPVQILAYAAALALLVSGWFFLSADPHSARIANVNSIIAMMAENEVGYPVETAPAENKEQALEALAQRLLVLQGFAAEDDSESELL